MRTVYVGVEDAEQSAHALRWAVDLVGAIGEEARVHAVHVVRTAPSGFLGLPSHVPSSLEEQRREEAERELEALVRDVAHPTSVQLDAQVVEGDPAQVLLDLAEDGDLLVLGASTKGTMSNVVLGSTSQRCVASGSVPVAIIPPGR